MAALASIPETNTSLPNASHSRPAHRPTASFERIRPRSRVLVRSRRPARVRSIGRRSQEAGPSAQTSNYQQPRAHEPKGHVPYWQKPESPATKTDEPSRPIAGLEQVADVNPSSHLALETSLSSIDLDSFPLPPTGGTFRSRPHHNDDPGPAPSNLPDSFFSAANLHARERVSPTASQKNRDSAALRSRAGNKTIDVVTAAKHISVDSALVEAISRTIIQQFRLFSALKTGDWRFSSSQRSGASTADSFERQSRTSSRREAVNRFTQDLQNYAETAEVKGKRISSPTPPPTPTRSAATLHTVSALLPFRPELRAAGLAVTSKDQAGLPPISSAKGLAPQNFPLTRRTARRNPLHPSQLDGQGDPSSTSTNTEISFAASQDMDDWRYALIDEAPVKKSKRAQKPKKSRKYCLSCFPQDEEQVTDPEWAHFRPAVYSNKPGNLQPSSSRIPPQFQSSRPAQPIRDCDIDPPSPKHKHRPSDTSRNINQSTRERASSKPEAKSSIGVFRRDTSAMLPKTHTSGQAAGNISKPSPKAKKLQRKKGRAPDVYPPRSRSDQARLLGDNTRLEPPPLRPRPYQSLPDTRRSKGAGRAYASPPVLPPTLEGHDGAPLAPREKELAKPKVNRKRQEIIPGPPPSNCPPRPPVSHYDPSHVGVCCRGSRGIPSRALAPPNIPRRTSSMQGSINSIELDFNDGEIEDRDVLRGLHVAASAACDEEVDAFVRSRTGLRIRRFLADLMTLESLGNARPGEDGEKRARRRRAELRKLKQQFRRSREVAMTGGLV